jgi:fatty acid desaturase
LDLIARVLASVAARPWQTYAVYVVLVSAVYGVAGHAPLQPPYVVEPWPIDARIPLMAGAAWPYLTYFLVLPALLWLGRRSDALPRVAATGMACALANAVLYVALPTQLDTRPPAPAGSLLEGIQRLDPPRCLLPSGHVALPFSIAVAAACAAACAAAGGNAQASRGRGIAALFAAWTVMLAAAALLTKQHYVVDVLAGVIFGAAVALGAAALFAAPGAVHRPTLLAFVTEWSILTAAGVVALRWWTPATIAIAVLVIATRQHALLVLYHDGVHKLVARRRRVNDFVVNLAVGAPMLLPIHLYRALHLTHHRQLGTPRDPERTLLYRNQPWDYRPLRTAAFLRQLAGDLLLWNALGTTWRYLRGPRPLPRGTWSVEWLAPLAVCVALWSTAVAVSPSLAGRAALLWFVPYLTLTQLLNKLRSFGEHASPDAPDLSYSWAAGPLGRLTVWPYNINFHREHHAHARVPWDLLPLTFAGVTLRPGRELLARVWRGGSR